jgi:hypothetical protein
MVFFLLQRTYDSGSLDSEGDVLQQMKSSKTLRRMQPEDLTTRARREYYD